MLIIVELLMLGGGLWAAATGKLPGFLFGGGKYTASGMKARLLGVWLALPLPLAFVGGIVLALVNPQGYQAYAFILEIVIIVTVALVAWIVFRRIREPVIAAAGPGGTLTEAQQVEATIARKANGALIYALLSILGFTALVAGPLAFMYASQALRLIEKHGVGERHRRTAQVARVLAAIIFLFYAALLLSVFGLAWLGTR